MFNKPLVSEGYTHGGVTSISWIPCCPLGASPRAGTGPSPGLCGFFAYILPFLMTWWCYEQPSSTLNAKPELTDNERQKKKNVYVYVYISSVRSLGCVWLFVTHGLQHARPPCPSPTPGVYTNSCLLSRWCHPTISSSVVPFSSCSQSFPASGSLQMSQFFASGGQSIGASASASVLPMNIQDWFPLEWTGWISLQSKGLSRVFSSTTVHKHQFFSTQLSLQSNSHIHTWLLEKP